MTRPATRLRGLLPPPAPARAARRSAALLQLAAAGIGLVAALVSGALVPAGAGVVAWPARIALGALLAGRSGRWLRSLPSSRHRPESGTAAVPLVADLLALALAAGAAPSEALAAVARALSRPGVRADPPAAAAARDLAAVSRLLRLGAEPEQAWERLGAAHPLAPLGRILSRGEAAGTTLAGTLTQLADRERTRAHRATLVAAQRAGVHAVVPLGLLFLPAFLLLGVLPVLVSALSAFHR